MKSSRRSEFVAAKPHATLTTGEVIRMLRELKGWTQVELARRCRITATNISLLVIPGTPYATLDSFGTKG